MPESSIQNPVSDGVRQKRFPKGRPEIHPRDIISRSQDGSPNNNKPIKIQKEKEKGIFLPPMWPENAFLLDMSLWFSDMLCMHGGELVGDDVQRHYLGLPGLWRAARFRKSVNRMA
ncbi:MAG: hypothetical protein JRJ47_01395 [Deltaproteobacteria bacterium]|nr:hypothetical protein [Deltaproteobacteria bacterium]